MTHMEEKDMIRMEARAGCLHMTLMGAKDMHMIHMQGKAATPGPKAKEKGVSGVHLRSGSKLILGVRRLNGVHLRQHGDHLHPRHQVGAHPRPHIGVRPHPQQFQVEKVERTERAAKTPKRPTRIKFTMAASKLLMPRKVGATLIAWPLRSFTARTYLY